MPESSNASYEDLRVWHAAVELARKTYELTRKFPKDQLYGLTSQIQRSVVSVGSNIAEGCARNTHSEFIHFLGIASGSLAEFVTQITIANKIGFVGEQTTRSLLAEAKSTGKMLNALKRSIRDMKSAPVTSNQ